jgi:predicted PurR-regulated permease PerM
LPNCFSLGIDVEINKSTAFLFEVVLNLMEEDKQEDFENRKLEKPQEHQVEDSPPWDRTIKIIVAISTMILIVAFALRFQSLILQIAAAAIIAYVVTPLIEYIVRKTPFSRTLVIILTYLVVIVILILAFVGFGSTVITQSLNLLESLPVFIENAVEWLSTTTALNIGPYQIDVAEMWNSIGRQAVEDQIINSVGNVANQAGRTIIGLIGSTVNLATMFFFTMIISVYLAFEMPQLGGYVERLARQPGYSKDARLLTRNFGRIWRAYLRGQIILGLVIGLAVWFALTVLGVQNSFALGVLSGLLEFLPAIGPFIGAAAAAITALLQPSNPFALDPLTYTLIVILVMILIQQIENNLLVPRIVGGALDLHPLIVIIGVLIGGSLAGLIGAILAGPVLATVKLIGTYAWRKMFDLPPFPEQKDVSDEPRGPTLAERFRRLLSRIRMAFGGSSEL